MKIIFTRAQQSHTLDAARGTNGVEIQIDDAHLPAHIVAVELPRISFLLDGKMQTARVVSDGKKIWVHYAGTVFVLERGEATTTRAVRQEREGIGSGIVTAPMPGQVRAVLTQLGEWVEQGQPLLLLEAMKMEIRVAAACAGKIVEMDVRVGQTVEREQILARIQSDKE